MKIKGRIFYGWVIVGLVFLIMSIGYAIHSSFPIFYVPILDEFGQSRAETALIFSISFIVYGIASAIAGALLDRFGPKKTFTLGALVMVIGLVGCSQVTHMWQIFVFWGIFSFGIATVGWVPCNALVSRWFARRRATAVGIAQAGGRESFIMSPLIQSLILALGWRNTYLVMAATSIIIVGLAQFLRHSPADMGLLPDGETVGKGETGQSREDSSIINKEWAATDWTLLRAIKQYRFWALFAASFIGAVAFSIIMAHQVVFMVDIGFTAMFASFMLLIFGITGMAGRFLGFISDITGREIAFTLGTSGVIFGFLMLMLTKDTSTGWMLYIYAACFGLFSGLKGPAVIATYADLFQGKHLGAIMGILNLGFGLGNAVGSWFAGYIFDTFGNYIPAFITAIAMMVLACISMWVASPRKIRAVQHRRPANRK